MIAMAFGFTIVGNTLIVITPNGVFRCGLEDGKRLRALALEESDTAVREQWLISLLFML